MWEPRILIVDDELGPRESYRQILKNDYEVILMDNGSSAIEYVTNHPVDVALVDIKMPDMDGVEVLKEIKKIRSQIEVIMITAYASVENAQNATKYGAIDYLIKPAGVKEIQATVKKAIAKRIQRMQYNEELSGLLSISQSITSSLDAQDVKKNILDCMEKLFFAKIIWLALYNPQSEEIELTEVRGAISEDIVNAFSNGGEGITEEVIAKRQIIIVPDVMTDERIKYKNAALKAEIKSIVGLPLMIQGKVTGVLGFSLPQFEEQQTIEPAQMNFLTIFANQVAIALENARLYSDLKHSEQKLQESFEQVTASLEEKKVLLREIHHRVKNNLQVISSLLRLQGRYIEDERYQEMFTECQSRIQSMALIHETLYQSKDLANIDFADYIKKLANSLYQSYSIYRGKIALKMDVESIQISIDYATPSGLILNELISNSLKHAFPKGREGEIKITLRSVEDEIELVVSDNGVGIPEDLDFRNTESLGLQLVVDLAENQLQGNIELDRIEGTKFRIKFKEKKYKKRMSITPPDHADQKGFVG